MIVVIQLLALREQRKGTAPSNLEQGSIVRSDSGEREESVKEIVEVSKH